MRIRKIERLDPRRKEKVKSWQELDGDKEMVEGASTFVHESMIKPLFKTKFEVDKHKHNHNHITTHYNHHNKRQTTKCLGRLTSMNI